MDETANRPPLYYRPGEVRALRDQDRRIYRAGVVWLVIYQIIAVGACRWVIDFFLAQKGFERFDWVKPYIILVMVAAVVLIWISGIITVFRRRF